MVESGHGGGGCDAGAEVLVLRRRVRRLWRAVGVLVAVMVLVGAVGVFAVHRGAVAREQGDRALSGQLAAESINARAHGRPETADLLAAEAYRLAPGAHARGALLSADADLFAARLVALKEPEEPVPAPRRGHAVSVDGRTLVTFGPDRHAEVWDIPSRTRRRVLAAAGDSFTAAVVSADGSLVVAGTSEGRVWKWGPTDTTGRRVAELPYGVDAMAIHPAEEVLAVGGPAGHASLLRLADGVELAPLAGPEDAVAALTYSPDGRWLAGAGPDRTVRLWTTEGALAYAYPDFGEGIGALAFSPDGTRLAAGGGGRVVKVWDVEGDRDEVVVLPGAEDGVATLAFSPDGTLVAGGGPDFAVRVWSVPLRGRLFRLSGHTGPLRGVTFVPDGELVTSAEDGTSVVWDLRRGLVPGAEGRVEQGVAFVRDGRTIVAVGDAIPRLWNASTGEAEGRLSGHTKDVYRVAASRDGGTVATASEDGSVRVWDAVTQRQQWSAQAHDVVCGLAISRDGRSVAAGDTTGRIRVWRDLAAAPDREYVPPGPPGQAPCALAFSDDGRHLAIGTDHAEVWHADLAGAGVPALLGRHDHQVRAVAWTPDGRTVASGSRDHQVKTWDVAAREIRRTLTEPTGPVLTLAYDPTGALLAAGGEDGRIYVWDTDRYRAHAVLTGHQATVGGLAFDSDGYRLASAALDGTVRIWNLDGDRLVDEVCRRALPTGRADWERYVPDRAAPTGCG